MQITENQIPPVHPLWQPIEEFDGVDDTYFIILSGSPEMGFYAEGKWWCYLDDHPEEVEPEEFMRIPMYRAWRERLVGMGEEEML